MIRLNIEQQYAKLELSITEPTISIRTQAPQLELHTEPAVVEIRQPQGTLEIDQYPCRASYGFKTITQLNEEFAQAGIKAALEATGKIAADGDRMARIESKENVIVALAKESTAPKPVEVVLMSVPPPIIRYHPRLPEYRVEQGTFNARFQRGTVDVQLQRGTVKGYMAQYPSIRMWTTGTFDLSV